MTDQGQPLTECPTCKLKRPRDAIQCDCGYVFEAHTGIGREQKELAPRKKNLKGLEGWLAVVGLGIIFLPVKLAVEILAQYLEVFADGTWAAITTAGTEYYDPGLALIIGGELAVNIVLIGTSMYLMYLYFSKKKSFPKWYIGAMIFIPAFAILDVSLVSLVFPQDAGLDVETVTHIIRGCSISTIWIFYMLESERVKMTFVR
jgi:hypothetical protein